jgi:hypothetical protein
LLGFAWFYSSESGLFNGLRRKKQKNPQPFLLADVGLPSRGFEPAIGLKYNTTSDFRKEFSPKNREVLIAVRHWAEPNKQI